MDFGRATLPVAVPQGVKKTGGAGIQPQPRFKTGGAGPYNSPHPSVLTQNSYEASGCFVPQDCFGATFG